MRDGASHVPFRDSNVTKLLADALRGNSRLRCVFGARDGVFSSDANDGNGAFENLDATLARALTVAEAFAKSKQTKTIRRRVTRARDEMADAERAARELCVAALLFPLACARAVALVAHLVAFAAISKLKLLGLPRDVQRGDAPTPRWRETLFYLAFRALMTSCLLSVGVLVRVRGRDEIRRVLYTGPHTTAFAR